MFIKLYDRATLASPSLLTVLTHFRFLKFTHERNSEFQQWKAWILRKKSISANWKMLIAEGGSCYRSVWYLCFRQAILYILCLLVASVISTAWLKINHFICFNTHFPIQSPTNKRIFTLLQMEVRQNSIRKIPFRKKLHFQKCELQFRN